MRRHIDLLQHRQFDLTIVGGGVYGAWLACEASKQGFDTALIEANDFASSTSANSLGVLHGGLRYLQHLNIKRIHESLQSRHDWLALAPHLIDLQSFLIPLSGDGLKGPMAMRMGLLAYQMSSAYRNWQLPAEKQLPLGNTLSPAELGEHIEGLDTTPYSGGGRWFEAVATDTQRLVLEVVRAAWQHGAIIANHVRADSITEKNQQVTGIKATDQLTGKTLSIRSHWVIDATGHGANQLRARSEASARHDAPSPEDFARANNVLVNRLLFDDAVGLPVHDTLKDSKSVAKRDERMIFFLPWQGKTLIGTFYQAAAHTGNQLTLSHKDKSQILADINRALPADKIIAEADICHWHSGWLPMAGTSTSDDDIELADTPAIRIMPDKQHASGIVEVQGVKFATAPAVAKKTLLLLKRHYRPAYVGAHNTPPKPSINPPKYPLEKRLYQRYGTQWQKVKAFLETDPQHLQPINDQVLAGEVVYTARFEMARRLEDVVWRRLPIAECGLDFDANTAKCTKILQQELGWSGSHTQREIERLIAQPAYFR